MFYLYFVCVCIVGHWFHESAPSSFFLHSDIFFSLTGVCGGPRNSSAHIATLTQTHSTPSLLSSLNAPPSPSFFNSPLSLFLFLHLSLFSPIFVFLNPSLTKKKKKKAREVTADENERAREANPSQWYNWGFSSWGTATCWKGIMGREWGFLERTWPCDEVCENVGGTGAASSLWMNECVWHDSAWIRLHYSFGKMLEDEESHQ